jgi:chaperonin GroES
MVHVRPLRDNILVQFDPSEDGERVRESGIIMPERAVDDVNQWGTVLAVGSGVVNGKGVRIPPQVKPGDRVLYIRYLKNTHTGESLRWQSCLEEDQFLIKEGDILAIEEGEGAP